MTPRFRTAIVAGLLTVLLAACGGSTSTPRPTTSPASAAPAASIRPIPITSGFRVGDNRIVFTLTDQSGQKQVAGPQRTLSIGYRGPNGESIAAARQCFIWVVEGMNGVYVGRATFPTAGQWTADFVTAAPGSAQETTTFGFDVRQRLDVVSPGDPAPSVKTRDEADLALGGDAPG